MTSPKKPTAPDVLSTEQAESEASLNPTEKPAVAPFSFPFNPAAFAQAKKDGQQWYQKSGKGDHHKTPGAAPHGTRKTMGKR